MDLCAGLINQDGTLFGDHLPMFRMLPRQYQVVVKFQVRKKVDIAKILQEQKKQKNLPAAQRKPLIIGNKEENIQEKFLYESKTKARLMDFTIIGMPNIENPPFLTTEIAVLDIPRCKHFDMTSKVSPKHAMFFLYGERDQVFLSHNMTRDPDFHQVVELDERPDGVSSQLLKLGIDVTFPEIRGDLSKFIGEISDPLTETEYKSSIHQF